MNLSALREVLAAKRGVWDVDLSGLDFSGQKMRSVNFMGADLIGASFQNADVSTCVLQGPT